MKARITILLLLCSSLLFGYKIGDTISENSKKRLNITENKIYIVDFFASWCPSCEKEMPYISKVNNIIDKNQIEIIGVGVDEDIKESKSFISKLDINFKVIHDPKNEIIQEFDPIGMPAIFFIKDNKVVDSIIGAKDNIDKVILQKLNKLK